MVILLGTVGKYYRERTVTMEGGAPADEDAAESAEPENFSRALTPLEREKLHDEMERNGTLRFVIVRNDGQDESIIRLLELKNIFGKQLPKMGKQYIARLVLDRQHESLAAVYEGQVVGGITYRPHKTQAFAEVVFCAVSAEHQVRGYGARIMNQLMEHLKKEGITHLLTYADNHAIGYFRKQGFNKQVCQKPSALTILRPQSDARACEPHTTAGSVL